MGGIFQLIAYGAQDLYLTSTRAPKMIREPKTLQKYAFKSLSEKDKTALFNNYKHVFPEFIEKMDQTRRYSYANLVVKFDMRIFKKKNKAITKMETYYTLSDEEAKNIRSKVKEYFRSQHIKIIREKRKIKKECEVDEPLELNELFREEL